MSGFWSGAPYAIPLLVSGVLQRRDTLPAPRSGNLHVMALPIGVGHQARLRTVLRQEGTKFQGGREMRLFARPRPAVFRLPDSLRADLRTVIESAPPEVSALLRSQSGEPALLLLNSLISADETVSGLVYCIDPITGADGYLALTERRLLYARRPETGQTEIIAIAFDEISEIYFRSGLARIEFGPEPNMVAVGFPHGGRYTRRFGEQLDAAAKAGNPGPST